MKYRPEIDGLRALAVVPVIFFHAGLPFFSGGFVGVDIFFVISGYLITSIILSEMQAGTFTLARFYERRARRILPALFLILFLSFIAAFFILRPVDMKEFSASMAAAATFLSNVFFWRHSGYFDGLAELKPLLHTWSLGVEEQYYILYPLFLIAAWRLGRKKILFMLAALFVLSLTAAHLGALNHSSGVFFLLPTRCWELLLGIFAAFYLSRGQVKQFSQKTNTILGLLGLVMIAAGIILFDENTLTPGLPLLLPTLGTVLIILFAKEGTIPARLLSFQPIVLIGLISYSAYLWHQPLLAFAKYQANGMISPVILAALCALTFILSYFSWRWIEQPVRRKNHFTRRFIFTASAAGIVFFTALGAAGYMTQGFEKVWLARHNEITQTTYLLIKRDPRFDNYGAGEERWGFYDDGACRFNKPELSQQTKERILACAQEHGPGIAVIGDSHAIDLYGAIVSRDNKKFLFGLTKGGCQLGTTEEHRCAYSLFLSLIQENPAIFSEVIFEQSGQYLLQRQKDVRAYAKNPDKAEETPYMEEFIQPISEYLARLGKYNRVLWFGPRLNIGIKETDILDHGCNYDFTPRAGFQETYDAIDIYLEDKVKTLENVFYLSQNKAFAYSFPEDFMNCSEIYWSDGSHLSAEGEKRFGARFDLINR